MSSAMYESPPGSGRYQLVLHPKRYRFWFRMYNTYSELLCLLASSIRKSPPIRCTQYNYAHDAGAQKRFPQKVPNQGWQLRYNIWPQLKMIADFTGIPLREPTVSSASKTWSPSTCMKNPGCQWGCRNLCSWS